MHTKEELTKKRGKSSEQLDLVNTFSAAENLKHKRRWLYLALFTTTGLSLFFWLYRSFKTFTFPKSFPAININLPDLSSDRLILSPQLSSLLSQHPEITGFYLRHDHPASDITSGSIVNLDPDSLKNTVSSTPAVSNSPITSGLPPGITYHENIITSDNQVIFTSLITNPIDQIFIIIRFNGSADSLKSLLPDLVPAAYWSVSSN